MGPYASPISVLSYRISFCLAPLILVLCSNPNMMFVYGSGVLGLSYRLFNVSLRSKPIFQDTPLFVPHSERTVQLSLSQFSYRPFFASLPLVAHYGRHICSKPYIRNWINPSARHLPRCLPLALSTAFFYIGRFSRHRNGTYILVPGN